MSSLLRCGSSVLRRCLTCDLGQGRLTTVEVRRVSPTGLSWWMRQGRQLAPGLKWRRGIQRIERLKSSYLVMSLYKSCDMLRCIDDLRAAHAYILPSCRASIHTKTWISDYEEANVFGCIWHGLPRNWELPQLMARLQDWLLPNELLQNRPRIQTLDSASANGGDVG